MNVSMVSILSKPKYATENSVDAPKMAKFLIGNEPRLRPLVVEQFDEVTPEARLCVHAVNATADGA